MKLQQFLEKFLPDYEKRFGEYKKEQRDKGVEAGTSLSFMLSNFHEALQNYTDMICKRQREIMYDDLNKFFKENKSLKFDVEYIFDVKKQPKIDEL